ncbi:hypothetical protein H5410_051192 [Solanum commersonii]|uniref:Uncharacterized protein n=1 Tax=Solanum commersonii TaxID=4109 RepID=A0A9J5WZA5_SOLCO|nr:hypothetical protein H5410_051192 [Solanum commersonii]
MSQNDFDDSPFVCLIAVSCFPSAPSRSGPIGGIVLLRKLFGKTLTAPFIASFILLLQGFAYWNKGQSKSFGESPRVLGDARDSQTQVQSFKKGVSNSATQDSIMKIHKKIQITYAQINCVLKDSSCDTPLLDILMLAILATCASLRSTKSI